MCLPPSPHSGKQPRRPKRGVEVRLGASVPAPARQCPPAQRHWGGTPLERITQHAAHPASTAAATAPLRLCNAAPCRAPPSPLKTTLANHARHGRRTGHDGRAKIRGRGEPQERLALDPSRRASISTHIGAPHCPQPREHHWCPQQAQRTDKPPMRTLGTGAALAPRFWCARHWLCPSWICCSTEPMIHLPASQSQGRPRRAMLSSVAEDRAPAPNRHVDRDEAQMCCLFFSTSRCKATMALSSEEHATMSMVFA